jgi:hypothetical protein
MNAKKCKGIRRLLRFKGEAGSGQEKALDGSIHNTGVRAKYQRMKKIIKGGVGSGVAV